MSRFDARYWMLGAGALGRPRGMVWGGRREEGSGWGTHVYLWWIHVDIWQNQYNIVKLKKKRKCHVLCKCKVLCNFDVFFKSYWIFLVFLITRISEPCTKYPFSKRALDETHD